MTIDSLAEAHIIKGRLLNEGIDCFLTNENITNLMPHYNNMLGSGVQIIINEQDIDKAREILKDKIEPNNLELACPNCGSTHIGFGKGKRFRIFNTIIALLSSFLIGNLKPKYYCNDCNTEIK